MVLTEAFAAGTPVVASDIAGYRDVVADGVDGLLFPRGDATQLAETLRDLANDPARVSRLAANAARSAERYAWPRVAEQVVTSYEDARAVPQPEGAAARAAIKVGVRPGGRQAARSRPPPAVAGARARRAPAVGASRAGSCSAAPPPRPPSARSWPSSTSGWGGSGTRWCARAPPGCCSGSR